LEIIDAKKNRNFLLQFNAVATLQCNHHGDLIDICCNWKLKADLLAPVWLLLVGHPRRHRCTEQSFYISDRQRRINRIPTAMAMATSPSPSPPLLMLLNGDDKTVASSSRVHCQVFNSNRQLGSTHKASNGILLVLLRQGALLQLKTKRMMTPVRLVCWPKADLLALGWL